MATASIDVSAALRLSRFYGWSLAETLNMPLWMAEQAAATKLEIEYEEFCRNVAIACAPNMDNAQRRKLIARMKPKSPTERIVVEQNAEKAREFFRGIGAKVNG